MAPALTSESELDELLATFLTAHDTRDWPTVRSLLIDEFAFTDHRAAGFGAGESADAYLRLLRTAVDLVPDRRILRIEPVPGRALVRRMGAEGTDEFGGPIVWDFVAVWGARDGRLSRLDVFEIDDLDAAVRLADELSAS
jgi:hypothetical protein